MAGAGERDRRTEKREGSHDRNEEPHHLRFPVLAEHTRPPPRKEREGRKAPLETCSRSSWEMTSGTRRPARPRARDLPNKRDSLAPTPAGKWRKRGEPATGPRLTGCLRSPSTKPPDGGRRRGGASAART